MTDTRGIGVYVAVAGQLVTGCSGEGPAFDASVRGGDTVDHASRDPKTSLDRERAALFYRAKALNVCASTLGDGSMHTVVQCPPGMQYDHGSERCFAATYATSSSAGDECRNGEDRCDGAERRVCFSGRWRALGSHASRAACEQRLLADRMKMLE
jgi:hypothetical protein